MLFPYLEFLCLLLAPPSPVLSLHITSSKKSGLGASPCAPMAHCDSATVAPWKLECVGNPTGHTLILWLSLHPWCLAPCLTPGRHFVFSNEAGEWEKEEGGRVGGDERESGEDEHIAALQLFSIQEAFKSLGTLWNHELLSCDVHIYNLTMPRHPSLACLNNILMLFITSRSCLARVLPADNRDYRTFKWSLAMSSFKAPIWARARRIISTGHLVKY